MRIEEAQLEQDILHALTTADGGVETSELLSSISSDKDEIKAALVRLKGDERIDSRFVGKNEYWYVLAHTEPKRILVVEDDKDINKLIQLSIGGGYKIEAAYDGDEALGMVDVFKPDLIFLDLMLPGANGLEICKKIKQSPDKKNTTIVIVSAADAAVNRFFGIKYGADYYIKKPFEPMELKALTKIFLKKHGSLFDPLVDLPDVKRLLTVIKSYVDEKDTEFTKIDLDGLEEYQVSYGKKEAKLIVRLVSQMLQDKLKETEINATIAYLGENSFVIAAKRGNADKFLAETEADFRRVSGFIRQKHKITGELFEKLERGKTGGQKFALRLVYYTINMDAFKKQFEKEIWPDVTEEAKQINIAAVRNISLDQIRTLFETVASKDIEVSMKEVGGQSRITAGRPGKK